MNVYNEWVSGAFQWLYSYFGFYGRNIQRHWHSSSSDGCLCIMYLFRYGNDIKNYFT